MDREEDEKGEERREGESQDRENGYGKEVKWRNEIGFGNEMDGKKEGIGLVLGHLVKRGWCVKVRLQGGSAGIGGTAGVSQTRQARSVDFTGVTRTDRSPSALLLPPAVPLLLPFLTFQ